MYDLCREASSVEEGDMQIDLFKKIETVADIIRKERDIEKLLWTICREVLKIFQADRVWLLFPCDPTAESWCVPIEHTTPEFPGAQSLNIDQAMTPDVAEIFQTAIDSNSPVVYGPGGLPLQENTKSFGVKSQLSMAIYPRTGEPWQFGMHQCANERIWSEHEIKLFQAIGAMTSEALSNLLFIKGSEVFGISAINHDANKRKQIKRDLQKYRYDYPQPVEETSDKIDLVTQKGGEEADCCHCPIKDNVLCGNLAAAGVKQKLPITNLAFSQSEKIYREGKTDDFIYTIRSGLVKMEVVLPDGTQKIVRMLNKSNVFGLESLISKPYRHTATALYNCEICKIPVALIQEMQTHSAALSYNLMLLWDRTVGHADEWLAKLNTGPARRRVIHFIDFLVSNSETPPEFILPSREDMSSILGITKETVSRVIADLKRDGDIVFYGHGIYERNSRKQHNK
ncbi:MAG: cyclic nucleotide-binding domain-containing protein [Gammaproteobacteria bacterium]|nr:MAG: cyclic nucleotide-binding domain-containing protein [Gammaproteobacteria bacterium]